MDRQSGGRFDADLRAALLEAARLDWAEALSQEPAAPRFSQGYLDRRAAFLSDPIGYARRLRRRAWSAGQRALRAAACLLLVAGVAFMLYLAWETFRSCGVEGIHSREGFLSGLLLQFINPKIYLYGILSMEAYVLPYYEDRPVILFLFALLLAFIGFVFTLCWSAFGLVFRRLFSQYARIVNTIMALLLVYCAVSLFL